MRHLSAASITARRLRGGFTLIEVLASVAILGTGISVFIGLYLASSGLAGSARSVSVAADLAQEQISIIRANPEGYRWPNYDGQAGQLLPVEPIEGGSDILHSVEPPSALPTVRRPYERERAFIQGYSWKAFSRLPAADANHVELVVEIAWLQEGREQRYYLTSAVDRGHAEGIE